MALSSSSQSTKKKVLIRLADRRPAELVAKLMGARGYEAVVVQDMDEIVDTITDPAICAVIVDYGETSEGIRFAERFTDTGIRAQIVVADSTPSVERARAAHEQAVFDYLPVPFPVPDLFDTLSRASAKLPSQRRARLALEAWLRKRGEIVKSIEDADFSEEAPESAAPAAPAEGPVPADAAAQTVADTSLAILDTASQFMDEGTREISRRVAALQSELAFLDHLVEKGTVPSEARERIAAALESASAGTGPVSAALEVVKDDRDMDDPIFTRLVEKFDRLPLDLSVTPPVPALIRRLDRSVATLYCAVPVGRLGRMVFIASGCALDHDAESELGRPFGNNVRFYVCRPRAAIEALERVFAEDDKKAEEEG